MISVTHSPHVINLQIAFDNNDDLKQFKNMYPRRDFIELNNHILWICRNKQFSYEIYDLLVEIDDMDALEQFRLAKLEMDAPQILSFKDVFPNWTVEFCGHYKRCAINPNQGEKLVSIELEEKLVRIPNMSWSEYCDHERAEYGNFCKFKFSTKELASEHYDKFCKQIDIKIDLEDNTCVIHGPRTCLNSFRSELLYYKL